VGNLRLILGALLSLTLLAAEPAFGPKERAAAVESFDVVWTTVRDRFPDARLNGLDWQDLRDSTRPLVEHAQDIDEVRGILRGMLLKLGSSHFAIIPAGMYDEAVAAASAPGPSVALGAEAPQKRAETPGPDTPAAAPANTGIVAESHTEYTFANLPMQKVDFEARLLPSGIGYMKLSDFLDPVNVTPRIEAAVKQFAATPGIIFDLRGNPGGIGLMAMGIAGFFVSKPGQQLGIMKMRDSTLRFTIFPRAETYNGKLAILVDHGSASTSEILAQGLKDIGRARIFGQRSAGAVLASDILRLPDGDGFQYPQAVFISAKGRTLEGKGVELDEEVPTDSAIQAAETWIH
jgi:hypothetical protein